MMKKLEKPEYIEICTMSGIVGYHKVGTIEINGKTKEVYKRFKRYYTYSKMQMRMFPIAKSKLGIN